MKNFIIGTLIFAGGAATGAFVTELAIAYSMSKAADGDKEARKTCHKLRMIGDAMAIKFESQMEDLEK